MLYEGRSMTCRRLTPKEENSTVKVVLRRRLVIKVERGAKVKKIVLAKLIGTRPEPLGGNKSLNRLIATPAILLYTGTSYMGELIENKIFIRLNQSSSR